MEQNLIKCSHSAPGFPLSLARVMNSQHSATSQGNDLRGGAFLHMYQDSLASTILGCDEDALSYQSRHVVCGRDSLFYTPVKIGETVTLSAMLDSGSMACTINESAEIYILHLHLFI